MIEFARNNRAATGIGYGLVVGLIGVVALTATGVIGSNTDQIFDSVADRLATAATSGDSGAGQAEQPDTEPPVWSTPQGSLGTLAADSPITPIDLTATDNVGVSSFSLSGGTLPPGLSIDGTAGQISGTPTVGGIYAFTISAVDAAGNEATRDFSITLTDTVVFSFTGADQSFVVPSGVTSISVSLWGAGGGGSKPGLGVGGAGAYAAGTLGVSPGDTLTVIVGEGGDTMTTGFANSDGSYGGGGRAGARVNFTGTTGGVSFNNYTSHAGEGGGRSAIRLNGTEVITAGAGGGGGDINACDDGIGQHYGAPSGGAGGAAVGAAGVNGYDGTQNNRTGKGGVTSNGGAGPGGSGGEGGRHGTTVVAGNGSQFTGGDGTVTGTGGGGGYYGGGGGASWNCTGGAGGGSSYIGGVTGGSMQAGSGATPGGTGASGYQSGIGVGGVNSSSGGDGLVILSY